ncbi:GNAT family N-acetyltransferase [Streptomyces clavuligerus]|uniref:Acetyltransferase n=1 Tax=Streptomyces clavuligerus TaxID=1901 RepID=C6GZ88_STRCL|nr:GNAT family N-acetyltransferase [Streptomyces clavuligerus]ANW17855.1 acetyltransferase [Streptomyces clavuligerus]AXU12406.1 GNAT family N-acetyltransferase [Streptomyces clavuligerus]EFG09601.1 acetyltransferase [Streptomyces clavuligerus]MBY6302293.1 GNAT family N-acetyltransferase [Streptomyces clavuligerus]QCS05188.1 GNAT family N-acetyltransferase [Streptomyces clavuligerus]
MTALDYRSIPDTELERALDLHYLVFLDKEPDGDTRKLHREILEHCDRIGAYEGDDLVGLLAAHPLSLSVPGGELPCAGVTFVSVAPTHRRRGVLSGMIAELYRRCAGAGQPLAALWVSEAGIYGRFGFEPATRSYTVEIDAEQPLRLRIDPDERPLRLVPPADAPALIGARHAAARAGRGGRVARDDFWWRTHILREEDDGDDDLTPVRVVTLGERGAEPAGYVCYRTGGGEDGSVVHVGELEAESPAVAAALWRYLASIDLARKVRAWGRPLDDPLLRFAADRDQVEIVQEFPALWLRLVDVPAALAGRLWSEPVDLVLEVTDDRLPANAGRYRLTVGPGGHGGGGHPAEVVPSDDAPDLTLDVRELAAGYLGDIGVRELVRAGLVTEHTPGAAERFERAARTELLPHTTDEF